MTKSPLRESAVDALTVSHLTTETELNQDFQQCHTVIKKTLNDLSSFLKL